MIRLGKSSKYLSSLSWLNSSSIWIRTITSIVITSGTGTESETLNEYFELGFNENLRVQFSTASDALWNLKQRMNFIKHNEYTRNF